MTQKIHSHPLSPGTNLTDTYRPVPPKASKSWAIDKCLHCIQVLALSKDVLEVLGKCSILSIWPYCQFLLVFCICLFAEDPSFWSPKTGQKSQLKFMKRNEQFLSIRAANNQKYPEGDDTQKDSKSWRKQNRHKITPRVFIFRIQLIASECLKFSKPAHSSSLRGSPWTASVSSPYSLSLSKTNWTS